MDDSQARLLATNLNKKSNITIAEGIVAQTPQQETSPMPTVDVIPIVEKLTGELDIIDTTNEDFNESPKIKISNLSNKLPNTCTPQKAALDKRNNNEIEKQVTIDL